MLQRSLIDVALRRSTSACRPRPTWGRHLARGPGAEHPSWRSSSTAFSAPGMGWSSISRLAARSCSLDRPPVPVGEHSAWVDRCAALGSIRHPHLVELVDYGLIGVAHRFEAWGMPGARCLWPARDAATQAALRSIVSFSARAQDVGRSDRVGPSGRPARQAGPRAKRPYRRSVATRWRWPR